MRFCPCSAGSIHTCLILVEVLLVLQELVVENLHGLAPDGCQGVAKETGDDIDEDPRWQQCNHLGCARTTCMGVEEEGTIKTINKYGKAAIACFHLNENRGVLPGDIRQLMVELFLTGITTPAKTS